MNSGERMIIKQAVRILSEIIDEGNHIEANFDIDGNTYHLTFEKVD